MDEEDSEDYNHNFDEISPIETGLGYFEYPPRRKNLIFSICHLAFLFKLCGMCMHENARILNV